MERTKVEQIEHETLEDAAARKQSHLELALKSQHTLLDPRFYYEPMLAGHPNPEDKMEVEFGGKTMSFPIWISSMTGGSVEAGPINKMLAKTAAKYGFGMGLGSCRIILEDHSYFEDFNLRPILGDSLPLFANIGIAQVEKILNEDKIQLLRDLVRNLDADGLIVHVNPLQELLQKEGDRYFKSPIVLIAELLEKLDFPIVVKEVGQGFGPQSMRALLKMPLHAIDFAASGGTNFSKLELLRNEAEFERYKDFVNVGHTAATMVDFVNQAVEELGSQRQCEKIIASGGITDFLDGYYCVKKSKIDAIYGQAAPFLKRAYESQEALDHFAEIQTQGLLVANQFLSINH